MSGRLAPENYTPPLPTKGEMGSANFMASSSPISLIQPPPGQGKRSSQGPSSRTDRTPERQGQAIQGKDGSNKRSQGSHQQRQSGVGGRVSASVVLNRAKRA
jgi:hypothetical protein